MNSIIRQARTSVKNNDGNFRFHNVKLIILYSLLKFVDFFAFIFCFVFNFFELVFFSRSFFHFAVIALYYFNCFHTSHSVFLAITAPNAHVQAQGTAWKIILCPFDWLITMNAFTNFGLFFPFFNSHFIFLSITFFTRLVAVCIESSGEDEKYVCNESDKWFSTHNFISFEIESHLHMHKINFKNKKKQKKGKKGGSKRKRNKTLSFNFIKFLIPLEWVECCRRKSSVDRLFDFEIEVPMKRTIERTKTHLHSNGKERRKWSSETPWSVAF